MALQPATRRLLTEAAAAAAYQPKGTYQPAGSYVTTTTYAAEKGAPSGIATLGSDGKVLSAQLPVSNSVARGVVVAVTVGTAAATTTIAISGAEATGLRLTATLDPTRAYEVECTGLHQATTTSSLEWRALAGSTAPTTTTGTRLAASYGAAASSSVGPLRGRFTVSTAGPYTFAIWNGAGGALTNGPGGLFVAVVASLVDVGPKVAGLPAVP